MTPLVLIAGVGLVWLCLFLALRRVVLWYFRIPERCRLLASIDASLQQLPAVRDARIAQAARRSAGAHK